jgi:hypothetical protein
MDRALASRAAILIIGGDVDEVLLVEAPSARLFEVSVLGTIGVMPACSHCRVCSPLK